MKIFVLCMLVSGAAFGQSVGGYVNGHSEMHDFYKNWSQPRRSFKLTSKGWVAKLRPEDQIRMSKMWVDVPELKRIREKNPDETGRDGHLCISPNTNEVLCWIPPTGGA